MNTRVSYLTPKTAGKTSEVKPSPDGAAAKEP